VFVEQLVGENQKDQINGPTSVDCYAGRVLLSQLSRKYFEDIIRNWFAALFASCVRLNAVIRMGGGLPALDS